MEPDTNFLKVFEKSEESFITSQETTQVMHSIINWLLNNLPSFNPSSGLSNLPSTFNPKISLILSDYNGGVQLQETFVTLSYDDILESIELCKVSIYWKLNYTPFAKNNENEFLMVEDNGEVLQWNLDIGVVDSLAETLESFLENISSNMISGKYQYLGPDNGLIESFNQ